jgi:hypothetical protein
MLQAPPPLVALVRPEGRQAPASTCLSCRRQAPAPPSLAAPHTLPSSAIGGPRRRPILERRAPFLLKTAWPSSVAKALRAGRTHDSAAGILQFIICSGAVHLQLYVSSSKFGKIMQAFSFLPWRRCPDPWRSPELRSIGPRNPSHASTTEKSLE